MGKRRRAAALQDADATRLRHQRNQRILRNQRHLRNLRHQRCKVLSGDARSRSMNNKFRSRRPEARRRRTEVRNPMGRYVNWRRAVGISHLRLDSLALARLPGGSSQNSKVGATTGSEYHMICNVIFSEIRKNAGFRGNMKVFTKVAIIPLISVQKEARVGGRGSSQDLQCDFIGGRTIWTFQTDNSHEYTAVAAGDKSKVRR